MKGFELIYNDQKVKASIESGIVSIFLSSIDNAIRLDFRGLDNNSNQHLTWFESAVKDGDKITINVVEVNHVTKVIKFKPSKKNSLENKLIEYRGLKKYLEKEGLIEKEE